jgi:K+-transporting ATPase A subunit
MGYSLILNSNTTSNISRNGKVETNLSLLSNINTDDYKGESDKLKDFQEDLMLYFNDKKHLTNMN